MRILVMTDSPFIPTGLGKVGREIAVGLGARGHEVGYIGFFHRSDITPNLPHNIQFWWTNNNQYGADILDQVVVSFQPEILITITDMWNLRYITDPNICRTRSKFQWCAYVAVDGEPKCGGIPPSIISTIEDVDIPIAYTEYAYNAILKSCRDEETVHRLRTIYHGVDTNVYKPLDPKRRAEIRRQYGLEDKFIFLTVSRNQNRKCIPQLFDAWKRFSASPDVRGKAVLWPHMNFYDNSGWEIHDLMKVMDIDGETIRFFPEVANGESSYHMLSEPRLAELYGIADAFVLLSGEGFGLPIIEAMATRVPCILMDHSACGELGRDGRALLVPVSGSVTWTGMFLTERPVPDIPATVEAMKTLFTDHRKRMGYARAGYEFAKTLTWQNILNQWQTLLMEYEFPFLKAKSLEVVA